MFVELDGLIARGVDAPRVKLRTSLQELLDMSSHDVSKHVTTRLCS